MDTKQYIESGILELYVAGALSEKENVEVSELIKQYPEIRKEVEEIERAIVILSGSLAPKSTIGFDKISNKISSIPKIIELKQEIKKPNWFAYSGWAASVLLAIGMFWMFNEYKSVENNIQLIAQQNAELEQKISEANESTEKAKELVAIFRDKDIETIKLGGQQVSPDSYAKVYWNKKDGVAFIDALGLPEPPSGKVYQVWSLTLNPLTPTSMGLLENFADDENKVFKLANLNESQAFGITLEPEGGSESPTMDQLYTLGLVAS